MKIFCPKPFEFLSVHSDGSAWVCCHDWLSTPIGNLNESEIESVWNSEIAKSIRRSILDGSFKYCDSSRCPALVSDNLPRVDESTFEELQQLYLPNSQIEIPSPKTLSLTYDPTCNLKCPSCRSNYIVLDKEKLGNIRHIHNAIFDSALKNIENIVITGFGDPFSSSIYRKFLKTVSRDAFPFLKINLMTNGLLLTPRMWQSISSAHDLIDSIHVSIDACSEETYLINRGGNFLSLMKNLNFIASLRKDKLISRFEISFVVQDNNYREMPDFVQLGKNLGCDEILFQRIINWGTFNDEDFKLRSIHDESHPQHKEFVQLLNSETFNIKKVNLSNLNNLRN